MIEKESGCLTDYKSGKLVTNEPKILTDESRRKRII